MKKKPCNECPFRKESLSGWLGTFVSAEELIQVAVSEMPFSCHKQTDNKTDLEDIAKPQCIGRLLFASKMAKSFRHPNLEQMRIEVKCDESLESVMNYREIKEHHKI